MKFPCINLLSLSLVDFLINKEVNNPYLMCTHLFLHYLHNTIFHIEFIRFSFAVWIRQKNEQQKKGLQVLNKYRKRK